MNTNTKYIVPILIGFLILSGCGAAAWIWLGVPSIIVGIGYAAAFMTTIVTWVIYAPLQLRIMWRGTAQAGQGGVIK